MDAELSRIVAAQRGIFFRWQALDCGYSTHEIATQVRHRHWIRLRRGAYAPREIYQAADTAGRHVLTVRAAAQHLDGTVVLAGYSALAVHGVPLWGVDLKQAHVLRDSSKTARREAGIVHHIGPVEDSEIEEIDGLLVTKPERSLVDACRGASFEAGVVMADGVRRLLVFDMATARATVDRQRDWAGSMRASRALSFSDPLAATVGESRGRVLIARIGLPPPTLQHEIRDPHGGLMGITDFYFEEYRTAAEFDGKVKYGRALYERTAGIESVDLGEVVWQEKRREDAIRDQGNEMVRFVWSELDGQDAVLRARFLRTFARSPQRRAT